MLWEIEEKKGIKYSDEIIAERKKKIHTHNIEELYKMACENKNIDRRFEIEEFASLQSLEHEVYIMLSCHFL